MTSDKTLLVIAVIAVIVAGLGVILNYTNVFAFERIMLGPTDTGTTQVTIESTASIRFSHKDLNWGTGYVDPGLVAVLDSEGTVTNFLGAGVTPEANGFILENTGTGPLILDISAGSGPFLDGTGDTYKYKVGDCFTTSYVCEPSPLPGLLQAADTITDVCPAAVEDPGAVGMWTGYVDMPISPTSNTICGVAGNDGMKFAAANDEIELNIELTLHDDISAGAKSNTITVTATGV